MVAGGREVTSSSFLMHPASGQTKSKGSRNFTGCGPWKAVCRESWSPCFARGAFKEDGTGPPAGRAFPFISFVRSILFVRIIAFLKQGLETVIVSYRVIRGVRETAATPAPHLSHLGSGSLKGSRSSTESQPLPDLWSQGQHPVFLPALPRCSQISHRWPSVHMVPG